MRASIQPGAAGSLCLAPDDLAGVMMGHPPYPVLADKKVAGRYRADNPDDAAAVDLARWARFETAHPDAFSGMYVFWCRRPESGGSG